MLHRCLSIPCQPGVHAPVNRCLLRLPVAIWGHAPTPWFKPVSLEPVWDCLSIAWAYIYIYISTHGPFNFLCWGTWQSWGHPGQNKFCLCGPFILFANLSMLRIPVEPHGWVSITHVISTTTHSPSIPHPECLNCMLELSMCIVSYFLNDLLTGTKQGRKS